MKIIGKITDKDLLRMIKFGDYYLADEKRLLLKKK